MDGLIAELPRASDRQSRVRRRPSLLRWLYRQSGILLFVVLPTAAVATYMLGFAADQYMSEARFVVRTPQTVANPASGIGALLGLGGGPTAAQSESFSVGDYLDSHDAVAALDRKLDLVKMFREPEDDPVFRLWDAHPSAEELLRYYRSHVSITYSQDTGITKLRVLAFSPRDAERIAETLLELGEARVNELNRRAVEDTLRVAREEVFAAEDRVTAAQKAMTVFRLKQQDINPEKTSTAQLDLVAALQRQLAQAQAQQLAMGGSIRADSPQTVALSNRIRALENQVAVEAGKLTGASSALAPTLADYEGLALRKEFASTNYNAAQTAFENAKLQALRQQLFVVRVVEPNLPEEALYPRSYVIILTVALSLLIAYGIGWLILAGVREHAA
jgi:capsular polysaccharide transport system permease protein